MKKDGRRLSIDIHQNNYDKLEKQAKLNNQTITKYIESLIIKKEKFNPQIIKTINETCYILNTNLTNYNALNSATTNLNQLMYFININEIPKQEEITSVIENLKQAVSDNKTNIDNIIKSLKPFVNTRIKKHKRKSTKNTKSEDE